MHIAIPSSEYMGYRVLNETVATPVNCESGLVYQHEDEDEDGKGCKVRISAGECGSVRPSGTTYTHTKHS